MIPYIHVQDLKIGGLTLHPFGLLVATGVVVGTFLATNRARKRGIDLDKLNSFITWMLVGGFTGAHMFDEIFYHPSEIVKRPWSLLFLWEGLSSFGGFLGALIGIVLWKYFEAVPYKQLGPVATIPKFRRRKEPMPVMPLADLILSVFPVAWIFGRSGCTVVHDHPGMKADPGSIFAVAYGPYKTAEVQSYGPVLDGHALIELRHGSTPQFDLGLLELLFTIVLALLFATTWSRRLTTGTYIAVVSLSYGPVRFVMDFLRIKDVENADLRYGSLTFAQWCCVALTFFGLYMVKWVLDIKKSGKDPLEPLLRGPEEPETPAPTEAPSS